MVQDVAPVALREMEEMGLTVMDDQSAVWESVLDEFLLAVVSGL
jgi:hypothetical protein